MLKFILCCLIAFTAICFVVGFTHIIHTVDGIPAAFDKEESRKQAEDKRILEWANSPTPGYEAGKGTK